MRILDENGNEISSYDEKAGYVTQETLVVKHHDAVKGKPGKYHVEVVKEYPNGGKDVKTVWDEEPVEAKPAYDETEEIQRYHPYTDDELKQIAEEESKKAKINSLYESEMTFADIVDAVASLIYGGEE